MSKQNKVATNLQQDFTDTEKQTARSNIGAQAQLTAGSNITINENNVISAAGTSYSAGSGINISNTNQISAKLKTNGGLDVDSNGLKVYNPVPNSPSQYYYLRTTNPEHAGFDWHPLKKTKFMGSFGSHTLTADDIANGYCDLQAGWGLPLAPNSPMEGHVPVDNTGHLISAYFVFFLDMWDADYNNGSGSNGLSTQCDYIESGLWSSSYPSFYGCELFDKITGAELERVPGHPYFKQEIRKVGGTYRYVDFYAPAFRVHFKQDHILQVGYSVGINANVRGIYMGETDFES